MFGGKRYRWNDYRLDSAGPSGPSGLWVQGYKADLPAFVDLRSDFGPVCDQSWLQDGSVAFAVTSVAEFILRKDPSKGEWSPLSVLYQYQQTRAFARNLGVETPSIIHGMTALMSLGARREHDWPSMPQRIDEQPPYGFDRAAMPFGMIDVFDVWAGEDGVYRTLSEGRPVIFNYVGPEDYLKEAGLKGEMPRWRGKVAQDNPAGHAMVAVGYDSDAEVLIVRNSFGEDWGDDGHFRMPIETFRAQATGLMAAAEYNLGRYATLMGESYYGEDRKDASHRKVIEALMGGELYPGESEQEAGHRKTIEAIMGDAYPGESDKDAVHRRISEMIAGGGSASSIDRDRAHRTFLDAIMGSQFAAETHGRENRRECLRMAGQAGLQGFGSADAGDSRRGAHSGGDAGSRMSASDAERLKRLGGDIRDDLSDTTDDASRDFRSRLRRQEDGVMREPRRGGGRDGGGQGGDGPGGDGQGGAR